MRQTTGAARVLLDDRGAPIVPLPDGEAFEFRFKADGLVPAKNRVKVETLSANGAVITTSNLEIQNGFAVLQCDTGVFAYRIVR